MDKRPPIPGFAPLPQQVLPLDPNRGLWCWLAPAQSSGASLPRELFVSRCVNDPRVLQFLCQASVARCAAVPLPELRFTRCAAVPLPELRFTRCAAVLLPAAKGRTVCCSPYASLGPRGVLQFLSHARCLLCPCVTLRLELASPCLSHNNYERRGCLVFLLGSTSESSWSSIVVALG